MVAVFHLYHNVVTRQVSNSKMYKKYTFWGTWTIKKNNSEPPAALYLSWKDLRLENARLPCSKNGSSFPCRLPSPLRKGCTTISTTMEALENTIPAAVYTRFRKDTSLFIGLMETSQIRLPRSAYWECWKHEEERRMVEVLQIVHWQSGSTQCLAAFLSVIFGEFYWDAL